MATLLQKLIASESWVNFYNILNSENKNSNDSKWTSFEFSFYNKSFNITEYLNTPDKKVPVASVSSSGEDIEKFFQNLQRFEKLRESHYSF